MLINHKLFVAAKLKNCQVDGSVEKMKIKIFFMAIYKSNIIYINIGYDTTVVHS